MNTVFAFYLSLLVVTVFANKKLSWCVSNENEDNCKMSGLNVTCVPSTDCAKSVINGDADVAVLDSKTLVYNVDAFAIVFAENYSVVGGDNVKYYGVAVVKKNSTLTLSNLKGKKSCHTGAGKNAGWVIPVGYFLYKKEMPYVDNQYKSAANYFGGSCVPGVKSIEKIKSDTKDKLCKLCKNPTSCSGNDEYAGYKGAFTCMVDGAGDVAFVKHSTPADSIKLNAAKYGVANDYKLLCNNGKTKAISEFATCNIVRRPASAVVVATKNKAKIQEFRNIIRAWNFTTLVTKKLLSGGTKNLDVYDENVMTYLGEYYNDVKALNQLNPDNKGGSLPVSLLLQVLGLLSVLFLF